MPRLDEVVAYETLNLRSVAEIRDRVAGRVGPVSVEEVGKWMEILARAKMVLWR